MSEMPQLLKVSELAIILKVKEETIRRWARSGKLPVRKLSPTSSRFILLDVLDALGLAGREGVDR